MFSFFSFVCLSSEITIAEVTEIAKIKCEDISSLDLYEKVFIGNEIVEIGFYPIKSKIDDNYFFGILFLKGEEYIPIKIEVMAFYSSKSGFHAGMTDLYIMYNIKSPAILISPYGDDKEEDLPQSNMQLEISLGRKKIEFSL
jgi:hypothetical protein